MEPTYLPNAIEFEAWLAKHHQSATELLIGFYKTKSKLKGITYAEALDLALAYGWIDAVRKGVDADRYTIRFTPRRKRSIWSAINIKRVAELIELGRMLEPGLKVFHERDQSLEKTYAYENEPRELSEEYEQIFREKPEAWEFFLAQAPSYRRVMNYRIMAAKQEETRLRRLDLLIKASAENRRLL